MLSVVNTLPWHPLFSLCQELGCVFITLKCQCDLFLYDEFLDALLLPSLVRFVDSAPLLVVPFKMAKLTLKRRECI